ncbi:MAG: hypothetical protein KF752_11150 [Pirellulaceae bacterium]|nr:hypothetical protein [Pirellulaceae bacterium]
MLANFHRLLLLCLLLASCGRVSAEEQEQKITFDEHIKPIFREHCTVCHSQSDKSSGLALDSYGDTLAGGSGGNIVNSGNVDGSRLYALITHQQQPFMPPDEPSIAPEKLQLIKTWIEQGMPENAGSKIKRASSSVTTMLGATSTGKPDGPPPMPERLLTQVVLETRRSAAIACLGASPWAPLFAVGGQEQVILYHAETAELLGVIPFPEGEPQSLVFTRDGRQLLIGGGRHGHSGCAVLVDVATGQRIAKVGDELDIVLAADISPNKRRIALAGPQKIIRVFDSATGDKLLELKKHTDWIYALRFSPDGVLLASGDRSNGVVVWEADSGNLYADLIGHKAAITGMDFRSDSNVLASSSLDGAVKLWDMLESKEVKSWGAHDGGVNNLHFSQDGMLATAGKDAKIKLWNGNGELQKEFLGLQESALRVALLGSGTHVAGGDMHGHVQVWRCDDPAAVQFVAANPPSIQSRLAQARQMLEQLQQELLAASETSESAAKLAAESAKLLAERQTAAQSQQVELASATAQEQTLKDSLAGYDQKIAALEQELAVAKQQRESTAAKLATAGQSVQSLTVQLQLSQQAASEADGQWQQFNQAAAEAAQKLSEIHARRAAAQTALDKAQADQAAVEQRAAELVALSEQMATQAKSLSEQLIAAQQQQIAEATTVDKMTNDLNALRDQLAVVQKRLDEAAAAHSGATEKLNAAQASSLQLEQQARDAEQAALEALESLRLFQQSFGSIK